MNRVELIGNVTNDIELKTSASGNSYARFSLATRRRFTDKDGNEITDFHSCAAFGKLAENISKYVKKGNKIFVAGELGYDEYSTASGEKRKSATITLSDVEFLQPKKVESIEEPPKKELEPIDSDDLPF